MFTFFCDQPKFICTKAVFLVLFEMLQRTFDRSRIALMFWIFIVSILLLINKDYVF